MSAVSLPFSATVEFSLVYLSCSCDYCRRGSYNLCPDTVFAATPPHDGTLSTYYVTQSDFCYPIPDHMSLEEGAMVEPVAVAVQIAKVGKVRANQTVVVLGCGPIGVLCQAVSRAYSAKRVIGVDISQSRLAFAKTFGADDVFLPPPKPANVESDMEWSERLAAIIKDEFNLGQGPDVVLEATGAQSCIQTGIHLTKKGGMYVQAGMGKEVSSQRHSGYSERPRAYPFCLLRMSNFPSPLHASAALPSVAPSDTPRAAIGPLWT